MLHPSQVYWTAPPAPERHHPAPSEHLVNKPRESTGSYKDSLRVLYDVSTLGIGHFRPLARTGVYRVAEQVAEALSKREDCDLAFSATYTPRTYFESADYLRESSHLRSVPLLPQPDDAAARRLTGAVASRINRVDSQSLAWRAALRLGWRIPNSLMRPMCMPDRGTVAGYDVFHSPFQAIPESLRVSGVATFFTVYDMIPVLFPQYCKREVIQTFSNIMAGLQPNDWIICISQCTRDDFCSITGFDRDRVFVAHLGASRDTFYPCRDVVRMQDVRQKYGIPDGPYVLSLNTIEPRKNLRTALSAFAQLVEQEKISDLNFVLVGARGWDKTSLNEALAQHPSIRGRVVVTGYVDDSDLAPLYSVATMFVYVPLYEGFGLPPLEAMQCGTPVITSATSSLPEVVADAGLTVLPTAVDDLSQRMLSIYRSPGLRQAMSAQSLARAGMFSWDDCAEQTVAAYRAGIGGR